MREFSVLFKRKGEIMNTKYLASILCAVGFCVASANSQAALIYNFSGSNEGGTGAATMEFATTGNTLTVTVDNISPTRLDSDPNSGNAPGITGFGFNLDPDTLVLLSWSLDAYDTNGTLVTIASDTGGPYDWAMGTFQAGISLDYLPSTGGEIDGALFNPDVLTDSVAEALLPGGGNDVYFTTAFLTLNFNATPSLNDTDQWSPFVRMQNVGLGGEGSLRLPGTPDNGGPPIDVPEPGTLLLLGAGLVGLGLSRRRYRA